MGSGGGERVDWVDYAKGWCIILVVMMHSTLGVGEAMGREGWLHDFVAWARPFRMPDFFLIAGLFLSRSIGRDWRGFLDKKVLHFVYFYALWTLIQFATKAPMMGSPERVGREFLLAFVEPYGTLWFIYLLPLFFVAAKLLRGVPVWAVLAPAAAMQAANFRTGWTVIDEGSARFVYFYAGYVLAPAVFALAQAARTHQRWAGALLVVWGAANGGLVAAGVSTSPGVALLMGFAGAGAVVAFSALVASRDLAPPLRMVGGHSIVIYLAFFLPMAATRALLVRSGLVTDVGTVSLLVTAVAVTVPLLLWRATRGTSFDFLFRRPRMFRLSQEPVRRLAPAE